MVECMFCRLSRARGDSEPECHCRRDRKLGPVHTALHVSVQNEKCRASGFKHSFVFRGCFCFLQYLAMYYYTDDQARTEQKRNHVVYYIMKVIFYASCTQMQASVVARLALCGRRWQYRRGDSRRRWLREKERQGHQRQGHAVYVHSRIIE
jgi:hypothetical protein